MGVPQSWVAATLSLIMFYKIINHLFEFMKFYLRKYPYLMCDILIYDLKKKKKVDVDYIYQKIIINFVIKLIKKN